MEGPSQPEAKQAIPEPPPADPPLLAHLDRLMDELHDQAPKALQAFDEEAVHRARVATRRLSAALNLVEPVVGKKRRKALAKVLRKLRRRLGPLRDADVTLGHLHRLRPFARRHGAGIDWLEFQVGRARDTHREDSAKRGGAGQVLADLGAWHPVREQIAESPGAIDALLAESVRRQLDAFVSGTDPMVEWMGGSHHHHDPHAVRIAGKALRYTLEMAVAQGHRLPASVAKTFKQMQDLLGSWHDDVVLTETAMRLSVEQGLSNRNPAMQADVLDVARITVTRSSKHLWKFARLWRAKSGRLRDAIGKAFPAAATTQVSGPAGPTSPAAPPGEPVIEPKTDPGPRGSAEPEVPAALPPGAS